MLYNIRQYAKGRRKGKNEKETVLFDFCSVYKYGSSSRLRRYYEGTLSRGLTAEELEEKLRSIQKKPTDEKAHKRWKGWFHNEK